jgi:serine/threonine protein kinase
MIIHEGLILSINLNEVKQVKIVDFIGAGAYGSVWKVRDILNDKIYALKHIRLKQTNPGKIGRFVTKMTEEAKINLPSPYIVKAFGLTALDINGLNYAILFEYVKGIDFDDWIQKNKKASWEIKKEIFIKILEGVSIAHKNGIYHKDLKPQNILISENNLPKILDFGLASTKDKNVTQSRELSGTLSYLAPESMCGIKTTEQFDIYSLGCILYDLYRGDNYLNICGYDVIPFGMMMNNGSLNNGNILDFDTNFPSMSKDDISIAVVIKKATTFNLDYRYKYISQIINDLSNNKHKSLKINHEYKSFFNPKLRNYDFNDFILNYIDVLGISLGLLLGVFWGWAYAITAIGLIFLILRIVKIFIDCNHQNLNALKFIIKEYPGSGIIILGSILLLFGTLSSIFLILSFFLMFIGIFFRGSELDFEKTKRIIKNQNHV